MKMPVFIIRLAFASVYVAAPVARATTLSDPAVDAYNCRMATQCIGPRYHFTGDTSLLEGAKVLSDYGTKTASYWLYSYYWNAAKLEVLGFKQRHGRLPTDAEFAALAHSLLDTGATLEAPVSLTLTAGPPALPRLASATLNGSLKQGVYGDALAHVTVYWGARDGGTNRQGWAHAVPLGTNTLVGTVAYAPLVSSLPAEYYYRYYAANTSGEAWSPETVHVDLRVNPPDYGHRMKVTFSGYSRAETLENFPVLVSLSTNQPGFSYSQFASTGGGDLRFTDAGGTAMLPHEIDEWNTNGTSSAWVSLPALSASSDFIWAYWGNAAATAPPPWSTNGAVWSPGCELVWHLKETTFPYADSARRHPAISGIAPTTAAGVVGRGCGLSSGAKQHLTPGAVSLGGVFTLSAWVNVDPSATSIRTVWANKTDSAGTGFAFYVNNYSSSGKADRSLVFETGNGTAFTKAYTATNAVSSGHWHLVSAVVDRLSGTARLYVDGTDCTAGGSVLSDFAIQAAIDLGCFANTNYPFKGSMDEVRIEPLARSPNWIWASWMTVASNTTFATYAVLDGALKITDLFAESGGALRFGGSGLPLQAYVLEAATSLVPPVVWSPLVTNTADSEGVFGFSDPQATNFLQRFYRITIP
jgi:hypothetical protein